MSKELLEGVASNDFECVKRVIVPHLAKKQTGKKALLGLLDEKDTDGNSTINIIPSTNNVSIPPHCM
jgi:hypothetical protein